MIKTHENIRQRVWGVEDRKVIAQNTLVTGQRGKQCPQEMDLKMTLENKQKG